MLEPSSEFIFQDMSLLESEFRNKKALEGNEISQRVLQSMPPEYQAALPSHSQELEHFGKRIWNSIPDSLKNINWTHKLENKNSKFYIIPNSENTHTMNFEKLVFANYDESGSRLMGVVVFDDSYFPFAINKNGETEIETFDALAEPEVFNFIKADILSTYMGYLGSNKKGNVARYMQLFEENRPVLNFLRKVEAEEGEHNPVLQEKAEDTAKFKEVNEIETEATQLNPEQISIQVESNDEGKVNQRNDLEFERLEKILSIPIYHSRLEDEELIARRILFNLPPRFKNSSWMEDGKSYTFEPQVGAEELAYSTATGLKKATFVKIDILNNKLIGFHMPIREGSLTGALTPEGETISLTPDLHDKPLALRAAKAAVLNAYIRTLNQNDIFTTPDSVVRTTVNMQKKYLQEGIRDIYNIDEIKKELADIDAWFAESLDNLNKTTQSASDRKHELREDFLGEENEGNKANLTSGKRRNAVDILTETENLLSHSPHRMSEDPLINNASHRIWLNIPGAFFKSSKWMTSDDVYESLRWNTESPLVPQTSNMRVTFKKQSDSDLVEFTLPRDGISGSITKEGTIEIPGLDSNDFPYSINQIKLQVLSAYSYVLEDQKQLPRPDTLKKFLLRFHENMIELNTISQDFIPAETIPENFESLEGQNNPPLFSMLIDNKPKNILYQNFHVLPQFQNETENFLVKTSQELWALIPQDYKTAKWIPEGQEFTMISNFDNRRDESPSLFIAQKSPQENDPRVFFTYLNNGSSTRGYINSDGSLEVPGIDPNANPLAFHLLQMNILEAYIIAPRNAGKLDTIRYTQILEGINRKKWRLIEESVDSSFMLPVHMSQENEISTTTEKFESPEKIAFNKLFLDAAVQTKKMLPAEVYNAYLKTVKILDQVYWTNIPERYKDNQELLYDKKYNHQKVKTDLPEHKYIPQFEILNNITFYRPSLGETVMASMNVDGTEMRMRLRPNGNIEIIGVKREEYEEYVNLLNYYIHAMYYSTLLEHNFITESRNITSALKLYKPGLENIAKMLVDSALTLDDLGGDFDALQKVFETNNANPFLEVLEKTNETLNLLTEGEKETLLEMLKRGREITWNNIPNEFKDANWTTENEDLVFEVKTNNDIVLGDFTHVKIGRHGEADLGSFIQITLFTPGEDNVAAALIQDGKVYIGGDPNTDVLSREYLQYVLLNLYVDSLKLKNKFDIDIIPDIQSDKEIISHIGAMLLKAEERKLSYPESFHPTEVDKFIPLEEISTEPESENQKINPSLFTLFIDDKPHALYYQDLKFLTEHQDEMRAFYDENINKLIDYIPEKFKTSEWIPDNMSWYSDITDYERWKQQTGSFSVQKSPIPGDPRPYFTINNSGNKTSGYINMDGTLDVPRLDPNENINAFNALHISVLTWYMLPIAKSGNLSVNYSNFNKDFWRDYHNHLSQALDLSDKTIGLTSETNSISFSEEIINPLTAEAKPRRRRFNREEAGLIFERKLEKFMQEFIERNKIQ